THGAERVRPDVLGQEADLAVGHDGQRALLADPLLGSVRLRRVDRADEGSDRPGIVGAAGAAPNAAAAARPPRALVLGRTQDQHDRLVLVLDLLAARDAVVAEHTTLLRRRRVVGGVLGGVETQAGHAEPVGGADPEVEAGVGDAGRGRGQLLAVYQGRHD